MQQSKTHVFRLTRKNAKPSIKGAFYPPSSIFPAQDEVFDKEKQMKRLIRVAPGEASIYEDEFRNENSLDIFQSIKFVNGHLRVREDEVLLLKFLRESNLNKGNENRLASKPIKFEELVPGEAEKKAIEKDKKEMTAVNTAYSMNFRDMVAYARVLGINTKNKDSEEIRYNLSVVARKDPSKFMRGLDDPKTKRANNILQAIDLNILKEDKRNRCVVWGNNNAIIVTAPTGQDTIPFFVEWTFGSEDGEAAYEAIVAQLKRDKVIEEDPVQAEDVVEMKPDVIFESALEQGVIEKRDEGYFFRDKLIDTSKAKCIKKIKENDNLKTSLQIDLS